MRKAMPCSEPFVTSTRSGSTPWRSAIHSRAGIPRAKEIVSTSRVYCWGLTPPGSDPAFFTRREPTGRTGSLRGAEDDPLLSRYDLLDVGDRNDAPPIAEDAA